MSNQTIETIKIMPTSAEQGEYVVINAVDYDPEVHELYAETGSTADRPDNSDPGQQIDGQDLPPAKRAYVRKLKE